MKAVAKDLLKEYYGIEGDLEELNAYASHNFLVISNGEKFVLKLYVNPSHPELIEAENDLLLYLHKTNPKLLLPKPIPAKNSQYHIDSNLGEDSYVLRLLSYVEGTFFAEIPPNPKSQSSLGLFLAKLDKTLLTFDHPVIRGRRCEWDIQHIEIAEQFIQHIPSASDRNLVRYFILQYRENVIPVLTTLRHSVIHNDANEWNILTGEKEVIALIDFGDTTHAPLIQEVAVALTYIMMGQSDPLEGITPFLRSYHDELPLTRNELELLYYFIGARLCISVCMSAYSKTQEPDNDYITISEKPAWALLHQLVEINPIDARNLLFETCGFETTSDQDDTDHLLHRNKHISKALSISYLTPIKMEGAAFQYMYANDGKTYLDCVNNIFHVGHGHPHIVETAQRQMAKLNTNTRYLYDQLNQYAENLLSKFDSRLNKVFFVNSGSAATDLALRLARNFTSSTRTLVMDHGYHGNTQAAIEVSPYKFDGKGGAGKGDHIIIAPLIDTEDIPGTMATLKTEIDEVTGKVSFIAESIVGCGGQVVPPQEYLQQLYNVIRAQDGICIADEVQTGFGRVGSHFWAYETMELSPDIVIIGKPMGNGHPLAAVVTTTQIAEAFENGMEFFSSFGGNPVSCAIGQAVLDVIEDEALQAHALDCGNHLIGQLKDLQRHHDIITDVRGHGLFLGVELNLIDQPATDIAADLINNMKELGILLSTDGPHNNVLKIKPPMCFSHDNADRVTEELHKALKKLV